MVNNKIHYSSATRKGMISSAPALLKHLHRGCKILVVYPKNDPPTSAHTNPEHTTQNVGVSDNSSVDFEKYISD